MAIQVASEFNLRAQKYLDNRQSFDTISEMKNFADENLPDGFITYNKEDKKHYEFNSNNSVDSITGKWKEYNLNLNILKTENVLSNRKIGSIEIINYSLLTTNIDDLKIDQLIYDTNDIIAKIQSIDISTGDVFIEIVHCNSDVSKIPEPLDDNNLYFRSRNSNDEDGKWVLFSSVDGKEIELIINKKDSSIEGNYIPKPQELVYDLNKDLIVLGDGKTTLLNLRAFYNVSIIKDDVTSALGYMPESILEKGQANGYAPLDENGLVPIGNLPKNLTDTYSKSEIDEKDSNITTNITTLINSEASLARNNENAISESLNNHVTNDIIHVTQSDKDLWNNKVEQSDLTDLNNHITNETIHVTQSDKDKWDGMSQAFFVNNVDDLPMENNKIGYVGYVQTSEPGIIPIACETYLWDGTSWKQLDQGEVSLQFNWGNIIDKPKSTVLALDNTVKVAHNHTNKTVLDKINQSTTGNFMFDGVEIGVKAIFVNTEKDLNNNGEENTLYVVYSDSRVRGFPSISVWRNGAYQILGRGTQDAPVAVGDMNILQAEYFSVEANKSFIINVSSNQFFAFLPVEILKEIPGEKDQTKMLADFSDSSNFEYNDLLLNISENLYLRISISEIPTNLDKIEDTYFSSVEVDLSNFKDIDLIQ